MPTFLLATLFFVSAEAEKVNNKKAGYHEERVWYEPRCVNIFLGCMSTYLFVSLYVLKVEGCGRWWPGCGGNSKLTA